MLRCNFFLCFCGLYQFFKVFFRYRFSYSVLMSKDWWQDLVAGIGKFSQWLQSCGWVVGVMRVKWKLLKLFKNCSNKHKIPGPMFYVSREGDQDHSVCPNYWLVFLLNMVSHVSNYEDEKLLSISFSVLFPPWVERRSR